VAKTHYINPRFYQNEKTISLNPSKPFNRKRRKPKRFSFLKSLILVLVIFSAFIGYSAYAITDYVSEDGWNVGLSNSAEYTYIYKYEAAPSKDMIIITLDHINCNDIFLSFITYSLNRSEIDLENLNYSIIERDESSDEVIAYEQLVNIVSSKYVDNDKRNTVRNWMEVEGTYNASKWIKHLHDYKVSIVEFIALTEKNQNPYDYFNYTRTVWDINGLADELTKAKRSCEVTEKLDGTV